MFVLKHSAIRFSGSCKRRLPNMRMLSYNIWFGGERPFKDSGSRRTQIQRILRACQADVVALFECNGWVEDRTILQDYQDALGVRACLLATNPDQDGDTYNIVVLLRPELVVRQVIMDTAQFYHGAIVVELLTSNGEPLRIIATHLAPLSPPKRTQEIGTILHYFSTDGQTVIMGDLNSLSPRDRYAVRNIPLAHRGRHVTAGQVDTSVIQTLEQEGMVDTFYHLHPDEWGFTAPTPVAVDPAFEGAQLRLDYIFVSSALTPHLRSCEVVRNRDTDSASDHFPILMQLNM